MQTAQQALVAAEAFIAGFEDDSTQEGVSDLLALIRGAIAQAAAPALQPGAQQRLCIHCTHYREELEASDGRELLDMCVNPALPLDLVHGGTIPRSCAKERKFHIGLGLDEQLCGYGGTAFRPSVSKGAQ